MLVSSTGSLTISLSIEIGFFISVVPLSTCRSCDATLIRTAQADSLARAGQHGRREPCSLFPDRVETERRTIPPGEASDGVPGLRHEEAFKLLPAGSLCILTAQPYNEENDPVPLEACQHRIDMPVRRD